MSGTARRRKRLGAVLLSVLAAGAVGSAGLATPATAGPPPAEPGTIPGAWIVTLEEGESPDRVADDHRRQHGAQVDHVYRHALNGYAARMSDEAAARVAQDDRVLAVGRDRAVHAVGNPKKPGGGGTVLELPTGVDRVEADASGIASIDGQHTALDVDVAVIDTGIDLDHPDLNVHTVTKNCSSGPSADDGNGHGTHVAGTVGAKDNGSGVVGVAPGARLWAVRVLNNAGSGTWSSVICGIDFVRQNASDIEVANMSLGGSGVDSSCALEPGQDGYDEMHEAICAAVAAGVTFVVAAGNDDSDANAFVPATYEEVVTVSALADSDGQKPNGSTWVATCRSDEEDTFANFSNWGADVDLIAPGVCIRSTWKDGGYKTISGTSMASPHVAGGAALYKILNPGASPSAVQDGLRSIGGTDWHNNDDGDTTQEPLLNVGSLDPAVVG